MKTITFRELLNMIYEEKVPERIIYEHNGIEYRCTRNDYVDCNGEYLSHVISKDLLVLEMTLDECITVYEEILDEKEKEYLSNIIRPFKKYVKCIEKIEEQKQERICISYADYLERAKGQEVYRFIFLPTFKKGTMYRGMELEREYTLEELGL